MYTRGSRYLHKPIIVNRPAEKRNNTVFVCQNSTDYFYLPPLLLSFSCPPKEEEEEEGDDERKAFVFESYFVLVIYYNLYRLQIGTYGVSRSSLDIVKGADIWAERRSSLR